MSTVYSMSGVPGLPRAPRPDSAYKIAEDVLALTVQELTSRGMIVPTRQVIYLSPVPADCEQLAVLIQTWSPDPPPESFTVCSGFRWALTLQVLITRVTAAIPNKREAVPTPDSMRTAALLAADDADALMGVVASCGEVGPELTITMGPPNGGLQSTELTLQLPYTGVVR